MAQLEKTHLAMCQYEWELTGIENKPMTILSKMIKFKGVKSFRVGLKNQATTSTLLLITANLTKMGLKAEAVTFSSIGTAELKMTLIPISKEEEDETGSLQLFTAPLCGTGMITGNRSFSFQIYLSGVVEDYRAQEVDLLLRNQLWSSFTDSVGTDFEIIAEGKKFSVHKYILAARTLVFAAKFQGENRKGNSEEIISSVDANSVQQFIKFIYTGELEDPVKSQHLMPLAVNYKIKTLKDLCQVASHDIDVNQMVSLGMKLKPAEAKESPMIVMPDTDSEINNLTALVIFNCHWNLDEESKATGSCILTSKDFEYQQERLFRAQIRKSVAYNPHYSGGQQTKIRLVLLSYHHEKMGYKMDEVTYTTGTGGDPWTNRVKMQDNLTSDEKKLKVFAADLSTIPSSINFHVKLVSAVSNFGLTFADSTWTEQLWAAAVDKVFTDVEFLIAGESMSAHRFLLSARSPVFAAMFSSGMKEPQVGQVRIDDIDPDSFHHFLQFLYTGTLAHSADKAKIFVVADKYQVETLMDLCRPSTQALDIEEITAAFLSC